MKKNPLYLGEFEELILLAILRQGENAYGYPILKTLEEIAERSVSIGAVYTTLDRLEEKGYVSSWQSAGGQERGGRAKRYFKLEGLGTEALNETERVRRNMRRGLKGGLSPVGGVA